MKAFALVLLCFVAAQARSPGSKVAIWKDAEAGAVPSLVHFRMAGWTNGLLRTCAGSIIHQRWLLTSASCITPARFFWTRYGAVSVYQPELVLETSNNAANVRLHPAYNAATGANDIALVTVNRNIDFTANIAAPILASVDTQIPASGSFCAYGQNEAGGPGETLSCTDVELEVEEGAIISSVPATEFDLGAPLVVDGVQIGILVDPASGRFLNPAAYREWIEATAGISLPTPESDADEESAPEGYAVKFVNN